MVDRGSHRCLSTERHNSQQKAKKYSIGWEGCCRQPPVGRSFHHRPYCHLNRLRRHAPGSVPMTYSKPARPTGNHLLDRLPGAELDQLLSGATLVPFDAKQEVYRVGGDGQPMYFPVSGVYSLLLPMKDGQPVEVAVVDSEGMLGIPMVLGMNAHPLQAVAQV